MSQAKTPKMNSGNKIVPADARARAEATDPAASIVLQAPAGSGKTTVLTQRFVRLLAHVDEPEEILAVTFTRKAAAAMRARIIDAVAEDSALAARSRAWDLANNPSRLRIQTIDSFNFWLASQLPVTAKAGGTLSVEDRPDELYERAARATLLDGEEDPDLASDIELLFTRLDNNWDNVEKLLAEMLKDRAHWLRHVLGPNPAALRARMTLSLEDLIRESLVKARALWPPGLAQAAEVLADSRLGCEPRDLPAWQHFLRLVLTKQRDWRKQLRPADPNRTPVTALIERLRAIPHALQALREISYLPPAQLDPDDACALDALARVLRTGATYLQLEFSFAGRVDHTYIAGAARQALADASLPTDLALRAGLALRHILVDEFQDISLEQFALLETLTIGWEEGDGRTLFVVGDPMQSIYQFREAEVGLFLRIRDQGIGALKLKSLHLTSNFRAVAPLVAWSNVHFARLLAAPDDVRTSAVAFTASVPVRASGALPAVELTLFADRDRAAEAAAIAAKIAALRRTSPEASVALLVSARAHAGPISAALRAAAVGFVGVKIVPLAELSVIRDLVALTRALHHLGDRAAWLVVLRAPWCGATLATLAALSQRGDPLLLWEALAADARLARCTPDERARLARIRAVLERALAARTRFALAEWLESTWMQLGGYDAYPAAELGYARAFFTAIAGRAASGNWRGPQDLDALLKELYAQDEDPSGNPVQIMTIHHAKGLQFDHVFVPALDRPMSHDREPLMRWLDLPRPAGGTDLLVAPVPRTGAKEGGLLGTYIKQLTKSRSQHEQLRLLYVACTRAKESLHLSAAPKFKADGAPQARAGTLLARLLPAMDPQELHSPLPVPVRPDAKVPPTPLQRLRAEWHAAELARMPAWPRLPIERQSLESLEFSWVRETSRHVGSVVHAALERFAHLSELPSAAAIAAALPNYLRQLRRHGVPEREAAAAAARVVEALARTCADERGRWILSSRHREAASELALTGIAGGRLQNLIIDRSFVDDEGVRWVIDFKTSSHAGGDTEGFLEREMERYRTQLTRNSELARALGPEPVRAALYLPLMGAFRELVLDPVVESPSGWVTEG
jgi:ATP-dependent exoDNAse (exonuclease V) beta subunit